MKCKLSLAALLLLPSLAQAGVREELLALEAAKTGTPVTPYG